MRKKLFTFLLAMVASLGTVFAQSGTCGDNLTWDLTNGVLTISGTGAMTDYPSYSSTPWYSNQSSIRSLVIEDGVISIGSYAFYSCGSLTSVTIPNSVTSIGNRAFDGCNSLTSVNITDIAAWCSIYFYNKPANPLNGAHYLYLNGELVTDLVIPNTITRIGDYAFYKCHSLTSVTIPHSVTSIGKDVFYGCCGMSSVTIPNSVTSIEEGTFSNCSNLTSITIPNSVTNIGVMAFYYCSSLAFVMIPNSVTNIDEYAFSKCKSLTSVIIPNSVTNIERYAFKECTGLTSITCKAITPSTCGFSAFSEVDMTIPLYVPAESVSAYKSAEGWKEFTNILPISQQGIEDVQGNNVQSTKILHDGQIVILRGEKVYTLQGQEVK